MGFDAFIALLNLEKTSEEFFPPVPNYLSTFEFLMTDSQPKPRSRTSHAEAILGPELYARLPDTKVLLVGAGGIGCELCECEGLHSHVGVY